MCNKVHQMLDLLENISVFMNIVDKNVYPLREQMEYLYKNKWLTNDV